MTDRRWLLALCLSLLVHLTVIGSPGWRLPFLGEPASSILLEAHIASKPLPAVAAAPPLPPQPQPRVRTAASKPHPPQPVTDAPAPPAVPSAEPQAAPPAPVQAAPAPAVVEPVWPRHGRIRFVVTRGEGEQGMEIGQSTHTWRHDGEKYALQAVTETTGIVALFRAVRIVQSSEGSLAAAGLVPLAFSVERNGKTAEGVRFDWVAGKATMTSGGQPRREVALASGTQDVLSQIYQIGLAGVAARLEMMIATGKSYGRYAYEAVGDEMLATRFGALRTWHVKTPALPGEQAMELWLAQDHGNLPVRIRFIDRKGEVFDQNAAEVDIDDVRLTARQD